MKQKTCRQCNKKFEPKNSLQVVCGQNCAWGYVSRKAQDKIKKENAKQKIRFRDNDRPLRVKEAQKAFNAYIRARDDKEPCISCQRFHEGQYHAGHYLTRGANPELRFEELNCHKQCAPCNNHLSGNIANYRINLVKKIGQEKVDWLEGPHQIKKYSCGDLKEIEIKYKKKIKEML